MKPNDCKLTYEEMVAEIDEIVAAQKKMARIEFTKEQDEYIAEARRRSMTYDNLVKVFKKRWNMAISDKTLRRRYEELRVDDESR